MSVVFYCLMEFVLAHSVAPDPFAFFEHSLHQSDGEKQYLLIKSRANLPQYGKCWTEAIQQIDATCARLTDLSQAALAMKFTRCFMEMSGGGGTASEFCEVTNAECVRGLPERVFQAYTHFYTHTQNICFYLMHQLWHSETERTITLLRSHSQSVSKQLEDAGRLQVSLLHQQRVGLSIQEKLVEHGQNLSHSLLESRGNLAKLSEEFRNSTIEHGRLLGDLFKQLAQLHNWIVGEYLLIEQIVYYVALLIAVTIFTSSKRSESCRLALFLAATVNLLLEWIIQKHFNREGLDKEPDIVLFDRLWLVRKVFLCLMAFVYATMVILYVDYQRASMKLMQNIFEQNNEILKLLKRNDVRGSLDKEKQLQRDSIRRHKTPSVSQTTDGVRERLKLIDQETIDELPEKSFERIKEEIGIAARLRSRRSASRI